MGEKGYRVVLTASATEMSDHNGSIFLGFGTCSPRARGNMSHSPDGAGQAPVANRFSTSSSQKRR